MEVKETVNESTVSAAQKTINRDNYRLWTYSLFGVIMGLFQRLGVNQHFVWCDYLTFSLVLQYFTGRT